MQVLSRAEWEILNATADDWENLEQMQALIEMPHARLVDGVRNLVQSNLLEARLEDGTAIETRKDDMSYLSRAWFRMTPEGKKSWLENGTGSV